MIYSEKTDIKTIIVKTETHIRIRPSLRLSLLHNLIIPIIMPAKGIKMLRMIKRVSSPKPDFFVLDFACKTVLQSLILSKIQAPEELLAAA